MSWKHWSPSTRAVDTGDFPRIGMVCARCFRTLGKPITPRSVAPPPKTLLVFAAPLPTGGKN